MKKLAGLIAAGIVMAFGAGAMPTDAPEMQDCACCHVSANPTHEDMALRQCTRPELDTPAREPEGAPEYFIIDKLTDIYVPVVFPHKLHAEMTMMGESCELCHHHNPEGPILSCGECHGGPSNPNNLEQPGLKGAYHRQCLGCHREWSHETECSVCHARREPGIEYTPPKTNGDIMGMLHPNVAVPDTKIYNARQVVGAEVVTFHHKEHVEVFGLKCVECHRQENCSSCHDVESTVERVRDDPHQDCILCHQQEVESDCTLCHGEEQKPLFNHEERTGFELASFHQDASCRECHEDDALRFQAAPQDCNECHGEDFSPEAFDHAEVAMALDELHQMLSCSDCHTEGLGSPGRCDACHDDGRTTFEDVTEGEEEDGEEEDAEADTEAEAA